jgi:hypothetical protein
MSSHHLETIYDGVASVHHSSQDASFNIRSHVVLWMYLTDTRSLFRIPRRFNFNVPSEPGEMRGSLPRRMASQGFFFLTHRQHLLEARDDFV